ncbi:hypothetical protein ACN47E_000794 [Coniothyrium glycines]
MNTLPRPWNSRGWSESILPDCFSRSRRTSGVPHEQRPATAQSRQDASLEIINLNNTFSHSCPLPIIPEAGVRNKWSADRIVRLLKRSNQPHTHNTSPFVDASQSESSMLPSARADSSKVTAFFAEYGESGPSNFHATETWKDFQCRQASEDESVNKRQAKRDPPQRLSEAVPGEEHHHVQHDSRWSSFSKLVSRWSSKEDKGKGPRRSDVPVEHLAPPAPPDNTPNSALFPLTSITGEKPAMMPDNCRTCSVSSPQLSADLPSACRTNSTQSFESHYWPPFAPRSGAEPSQLASSYLGYSRSSDQGPLSPMFRSSSPGASLRTCDSREGDEMLERKGSSYDHIRSQPPLDRLISDVRRQSTPIDIPGPEAEQRRSSCRPSVVIPLTGRPTSPHGHGSWRLNQTKSRASGQIGTDDVGPPFIVSPTSGCESCSPTTSRLRSLLLEKSDQGSLPHVESNECMFDVDLSLHQSSPFRTPSPCPPTLHVDDRPDFSITQPAPPRTPPRTLRDESPDEETDWLSDDEVCEDSSSFLDVNDSQDLMRGRLCWRPSKNGLYPGFVGFDSDIERQHDSI